MTIANNLIDGASCGAYQGVLSYSKITDNVIRNSGCNGITIGSYFSVSAYMVVTGNIIMNSNLTSLTPYGGVFKDAIAVGCWQTTTTLCDNGGLANSIIANNVIGDDQATPTTRYGVSSNYASYIQSNNLFRNNNFSNMVSGNYNNIALNYTTPQVLGQSHITMIVASSGSMGNNGVVSGMTALFTTYANAYLCLPAGAIASGSAAGCYYYVASSPTAGTVYNNPYVSGTPTIPATPTPFVTTGPGAFAPATGVNIVTYSLPIPANLLGPNDTIRLSGLVDYNNSAGAKQVFPQYGGSVLGSASATTTTELYFVTGFSNAGVQTSQVILGSANLLTPTVATHAARLTQNSTTALNLTIQFRLPATTDFMSLENLVVEYIPGV